VALVSSSPTSSPDPLPWGAAKGATGGSIVHTVALTFPQAKAKLTIRQKGGFVRSQPGSYFDGIWIGEGVTGQVVFIGPKT